MNQSLKEDILDRESQELLDSESFEDVKDDLIEEEKEIKEEDLGQQMDDEDEEEEAKFSVEVKGEKVDPSELSIAPGWKVKFGKGRNADRFFAFYLIIINVYKFMVECVISLSSSSLL